MRASAVHQFIPSFVPRDAIGAHALQVQSVLRELGLGSELYVIDSAPEFKEISKPLDRYRSRAGEWVMYQASTGSAMADWLIEHHPAELVNYHNVTPASLMARWEPRLADEVGEGRRQIAKLSVACRHAIAVSRYNEAELVEFGARSTSTVPLLLDTAAMDAEPDRVTAEWLSRTKDGGGIDILFVGRIVPNKAQHDIVKALAAYRTAYDPKARLHLLGGTSAPNYMRALRRFVAALELWDAVDLAGSVSDGERAAYYQAADVFVCLSDHEGVGVPILEALHYDVPVVAFASSGVPETLGGAGVLLDSKQPTAVAAAIHRVVTDSGLRQSLAAAGRRRVSEFDLTRTRPKFADAITAALEGS